MLKTILWDYRFVIAVVIAFAIYFLFEREKGLKTLFALMLQAKSLAKDAILKSGKEQEDWVVERALYYLPVSWKLLFGEAQVRKTVKWLFHKGKDYLDDGKFNNSIGGW